MSNTATPIVYKIIASERHAHLFTVHCQVNQPDSQGQCFSLPTWLPGSYLIREFARHVVKFEAFCGDQSVVVNKVDKTTWQCQPCEGKLTVVYQVYAWDLSVRGAHLDQTHGYFNGACVFVCPQGYEHSPCELEIVSPEQTGWRVATGLTKQQVDQAGFGLYQAQNYDELIDCPVEMGEFEIISFEVAGIPHDMVFSGHYRCHAPRLAKDIQRVCQGQVDLFGELPDMSHYVFLVMVLGAGYGGLEHRNSCSLICDRGSLPRSMDEPVSDEYLNFLGLCSHEYLHTWHVKRTKPAVFMPYDLSQEAYTQQLWVFEGMTSYFDDLNLVRCGLIDASTYLDLLAQTITRVYRGQGRFKQSVADSSFDAWTRFYRQDENAPNAIVSYYAKGALIALALDLILRRDSQTNLNQIMRLAWQQYGKPMIGMPEDGMEKLIQQHSGLDLSEFFQTYLYDCQQDLPLPDLLQSVGVSWHLQAARSNQDKGGGEPVLTVSQRCDLGIRLSLKSATARISHVFDRGAGQIAGLAAEDELVALDGLKVTKANFSKLLAYYQVGDTLIAHVFRGDELLSLSITLQAAPVDTCVLGLEKQVGDAVLKTRLDWLHRIN